MTRRNCTPPSLWTWSALVGSISTAVSGVATMWLPWPWDAIAWAALAAVLCTAGGLLYPVGSEDKSVERCRLVTIDLDGEQITMPVFAEQPMSDESRAAFTEIVAAAKRKFEAEAGQRCGHTVPSVHTDRDLVCAKDPHPDDPWHADGSGARWRQKTEGP